MVHMPSSAMVPPMRASLPHDAPSRRHDDVAAVLSESVGLRIGAGGVGVPPRQECHASPEVGGDLVLCDGPVANRSAHPFVDQLEQDQRAGVAGDRVWILQAGVEEILKWCDRVLRCQVLEVGQKFWVDAGPFVATGVVGSVGAGIVVPDSQRADAEQECVWVVHGKF